MPNKKTLLQGVMDYKPEYVRGTVYVEPKLDGWGAMFKWVAGVVKAFTHTGTPLELPTQCKQVAEVLPTGFFFHAELTHLKGWQQIKSAIAYDPDSLIVNIFDMVSEEFFVAGVDLRGYTTRKKALYKVFAEKEPFVLGSQLLTYAHFDKLTVITKDESINVEKIPEVHSIHLKLGHEGSVLKRPNSLYNLGKTTDWLRMKPVPTQDCEIVEAVYNKPGELTVVKVLDEKGVICKVNALGWNEIGLHINNESSILGKIIEVAYSHLTEAGLMREPRFVRFREDKTSE